LPLSQLASDEPHVAPAPQSFAGAHEPPQSTSVSSPFFTPSEHEASAQAPPEQLPLAQSASPRQSAPVSQPSQAPPQSTSLSFWFNVPSLQLGGWQRAGVPEHTRLLQSVSLEQSSPSAQATQSGPPQSASVSSPLRVPSPHPALWQKPAVHTPSAQSR